MPDILGPFASCIGIRYVFHDTAQCSEADGKPLGRVTLSLGGYFGSQ